MSTSVAALYLLGLLSWHFNLLIVRTLTFVFPSFPARTHRISSVLYCVIGSTR